MLALNSPCRFSQVICTQHCRGVQTIDQRYPSVSGVYRAWASKDCLLMVYDLTDTTLWLRCQWHNASFLHWVQNCLSHCDLLKKHHVMLRGQWGCLLIITHWDSGLQVVAPQRILIGTWNEAQNQSKNICLINSYEKPKLLKQNFFLNCIWIGINV